MTIRSETVADEQAIREVTRRAFFGRHYSAGNEQDIVDALRVQCALTVSLVADNGTGVVGHVAFSPARAENGEVGWYTLGPVSVTPECQRRGIGQALVNAGIQQLRERGASGCIVLGSTAYYSRFGFTKAPRLAPPGAPAEHFMVLSLGASMPSAPVHFHAAFGVEG